MYMYPRIKDLREDRDLTQQQIAERLGQHLTTYRRWESGEIEVHTHIIIELCAFYNVSADYILGFTDDLKKRP